MKKPTSRKTKPSKQAKSAPLALVLPPSDETAQAWQAFLEQATPAPQIIRFDSLAEALAKRGRGPVLVPVAAPRAALSAALDAGKTPSVALAEWQAETRDLLTRAGRSTRQVLLVDRDAIRADLPALSAPLAAPLGLAWRVPAILPAIAPVRREALHLMLARALVEADAPAAALATSLGEALLAGAEPERPSLAALEETYRQPAGSAETAMQQFLAELDTLRDGVTLEKRSAQVEIGKLEERNRILQEELDRQKVETAQMRQKLEAEAEALAAARRDSAAEDELRQRVHDMLKQIEGLQAAWRAERRQLEGQLRSAQDFAAMLEARLETAQATGGNLTEAQRRLSQLEQEREGLLSGLSAADGEIEALQGKLRQLSDRQKQEQETYLPALTALEAELADHEARLAEAAAREAELAKALKQEQETYLPALTALEAELADHEARLAEAAAREAELTETLKQEQETYVPALATLETELAGREALLAEAATREAELTAECARHAEHAGLTRTTLELMQAELVAQAQALAEGEQALKQERSDRLMQKAAQQAGDRQREAAQLRQRQREAVLAAFLLQGGQEADALRGQLAAEQQARARQEEELQGEIEGLSAELDKVFNSRSWRATRPLRSASSSLRGKPRS